MLRWRASSSRDATSLMHAEPKPLSERVGLRRLVHDLRHRRHRSRQFVGVAFLMALTIIGAPIADLYYWGVGLVLLGIAVRLWASGHVKKDKVLATTGPYAYVRHPHYVGNHLITVGFCLAASLWWGFLAWVALALF